MRARYNWVGNKIDAEDMASLYKMKQSTRRPITVLVAEAVSEYIKARGCKSPAHEIKVRGE
ncbi:MAG: hypothetical protein KKA10_16300 [Euryarchaeota archaeon]|nr:hypothetical protein [Euryarchaeota archaeon]